MISTSSISAVTVLIALISHLTLAFVPSSYYFGAQPSHIMPTLFMSDPIPVPDPAFIPPPAEPVPGVPDIQSPVPMPQVPEPAQTPVPAPGPEVVPPPAVGPKRDPATM